MDYCSVSLQHKKRSSNGNVPRSWKAKTRRRKKLYVVWVTRGLRVGPGYTQLAWPGGHQGMYEDIRVSRFRTCPFIIPSCHKISLFLIFDKTNICSVYWQYLTVLINSSKKCFINCQNKGQWFAIDRSKSVKTVFWE